MIGSHTLQPLPRGLDQDELQLRKRDQDGLQLRKRDRDRHVPRGLDQNVLHPGWLIIQTLNCRNC